MPGAAVGCLCRKDRGLMLEAKVAAARRPATPAQMEAIRRLGYKDEVVSELHAAELIGYLTMIGHDVTWPQKE